MRKITLLMLAVPGLALAACNNAGSEKTADKLEDQADQVRASADAKADAMEDAADNMDAAPE